MISEEVSVTFIAISYFQISWYKNGNVKLTTSDEIDLQHSISSDDKKYSLKIEKLRERNFGLYSCRASNDLGSSEATIEISGKLEFSSSCLSQMAFWSI